LNIRFASLAYAFVLALTASETLLTFGAGVQIATAGIGGASPVGGSAVPVRLASESLPTGKQDPAERSARSIECAQKADAQELRAKTRKHFLRECKRGS
jgi:hypothetical protein